jgi:DNA-binding NtrC family response regulator
MVQLDDIPFDLALGPGRSTWDDRLTFREARQEFERQLILRALDRAGGNQTEAARRLGLHRNTLVTKVAQLGLKAHPLSIS